MHLYVHCCVRSPYELTADVRVLFLSSQPVFSVVATAAALSPSLRLPFRRRDSHGAPSYDFLHLSRPGSVARRAERVFGCLVDLIV